MDSDTGVMITAINHTEMALALMNFSISTVLSDKSDLDGAKEKLPRSTGQEDHSTVMMRNKTRLADDAYVSSIEIAGGYPSDIETLVALPPVVDVSLQIYRGSLKVGVAELLL